jgi:AbrB family looped-hinge helix DNA binding protein
MKTIEATITSQGQVTIPAEVRRRLGLAKRGRVQFVLDDDQVRLRAPRLTLEEVFGSVPAIPGTSDDWDEEIEVAMFEETKRLIAPRGDE